MASFHPTFNDAPPPYRQHWIPVLGKLPANVENRDDPPLLQVPFGCTSAKELLAAAAELHDTYMRQRHPELVDKNGRLYAHNGRSAVTTGSIDARTRVADGQQKGGGKAYKTDKVLPVSLVLLIGFQPGAHRLSAWLPLQRLPRLLGRHRGPHESGIGQARLALLQQRLV